MFSEKELLKAIKDLEKAPQTFQDIQKLATFYSIYDHLYGYSFATEQPVKEPVKQTIIEYYGDSEFLTSVEGKDAELVFEVLDELMDAVKVLQPRLYNATIQRLKEVI